MALPGYEYDIFVSYRHNDNKTLAGKGEGWVTEFVANLGLELEATVKGKVSIYYDENPHDGLLETHNVDESLSSKLKCLIFIPIISQTYCDPESFAWRNEFQPFNKMAASDQFGPTIKLLNGNVSNRVLPVRIHELEASDIKILEAELKGKLRPIDFIFKSTGVNRPLRADEDDPLKNANKTQYRDQINKTANAIKDIINGLRNVESPAALVAERAKPKATSILQDLGKKVVIVKSVAILPFENVGGKEQEYLGDGIAEEVLNSLARLKDLKVTPRASSFQMRDPKLNLRAIGEKLGVGTLLKGTVERKDKKIVVTVTLGNSKDGTDLWSQRYEVASDDIFNLPNKITYLVAENLKVTVRESERKMIDKTYTRNAAAFDLYLKGRFFWNRQGEDLMKSVVHLQEAANLDPQFALALAAVADVYVLLGYYGLVTFQEAILKSKEAALKALAIDPSLTEAYSALAFISMCYEWNWPEAEQYFSKVFAINPNNPTARERYDLYLNQIKSNFREAEAEPLQSIPYFLQSYALLHRGKFEEALKAGEKAVKRDPNSFMSHRSVGLSYLGQEKYEQAIESLLAASRLSNGHPRLVFELMGAYILAGKNEEAQAVLEETLAGSNTLPAKIHDFFFPASS